jgi:DNA-binding MarR family transcriptional regulator
MAKRTISAPSDCNCLAMREAARYITQFYDQHLAVAGLRTTQYGILAKLNNHGSMSINALAAELVMDRTTLGRNVRSLERDGLITIEPDPDDRRSKVLRLSRSGEHRLDRARKGWAEAQKRFEEAYGSTKASNLRRSLRAVITSDLGSLDSLLAEKPER